MVLHNKKVLKIFPKVITEFGDERALVVYGDALVFGKATSVSENKYRVEVFDWCEYLTPSSEKALKKFQSTADDTTNGGGEKCLLEDCSLNENDFSLFLFGSDKTKITFQNQEEYDSFLSCFCERVHACYGW